MGVGSSKILMAMSLWSKSWRDVSILLAITWNCRERMENTQMNKKIIWSFKSLTRLASFMKIEYFTETSS